MRISAPFIAELRCFFFFFSWNFLWRFVLDVRDEVFDDIASSHSNFAFLTHGYKHRKPKVSLESPFINSDMPLYDANFLFPCYMETEDWGMTTMTKLNPTI